MDYKKLKLGFGIGFYAFIFFLLLVGVVIGFVQLWLINPLALVLGLIISFTPIIMVGVLRLFANFKIVRRE